MNWHDTYHIPKRLGDSVIARPVMCLRTGSFLDDAEYARRAAFKITESKVPRWDMNRRTLDYV